MSRRCNRDRGRFSTSSGCSDRTAHNGVGTLTNPAHRTSLLLDTKGRTRHGRRGITIVVG
ncbi:hypothetical protein RHCRD62_10525 [Rhodococcus sp. RD6.2]|nr:hypothetical protein RHCRD62_10525 [Rhodococcus sp. RD6.2]